MFNRERVCSVREREYAVPQSYEGLLSHSSLQNLNLCQWLCMDRSTALTVQRGLTLLWASPPYRLKNKIKTKHDKKFKNLKDIESN